MQKVLLSFVHLYAKEYGWTRDYILDCVYIDEHILQEEMIADDRRTELLIKSNISLLPHTKDEARDSFMKSLQKPVKPEYFEENQKTDLDAIRRAKAQFEQLAGM